MAGVSSVAGGISFCVSLLVTPIGWMISLTTCSAQVLIGVGGILNNAAGFAKGAILTVWGYLPYVSLSCKQSMSGVTRVATQIFVAIRRNLPKRSPWWFRLIVHYLWTVLGILLLAMQFTYNAFPHLIIQLAFAIFWYCFGVPYMLALEEHPAVVSETISLVNEGIGSILNYFLSLYDMIILIINPFLPVTWIVSNFFFKLGMLISSLIANVGGFTASFTLDTSAVNNLVNYAGGGRRVLDSIPNPVFSGEANQFFPVSQSEYRTYESVIGIIASVIGIIGDILYIIAEVLSSFIATDAQGIRKIVGFAVYGALCASQNGGCFALEVISVPINDILSPVNSALTLLQLPSISVPLCKASDYSSSTNCKCSAAEGGVFTNQRPCASSTFVCVQSTNINNQLLFTEYKTGSSFPENSNTNIQLGCPNSFNQVKSTNSRSLLGVDSPHGFLSKGTFVNTLQQAYQINTPDEEIGMECSKSTLLPVPLPDTVFSLLCLLKRLSLIPPTQTRIRGKRSLFQDDKEKESTSRSSIMIYLDPFENFTRNFESGSLDLESGLVALRHDLWLTHSNFMQREPKPEEAPGAFYHIAKNITRSLLNHLEETTNEYHESLLHAKAEEIHAQSPRRKLEDMNLFNNGGCGLYGRLCPDGTCAKDDDLKNCKWSSKASFGSLIRTIPYFAIVGFESINIRLFLQNTLDCWNKIIANPSLNPANQYNTLQGATSDPTQSNVLFCFPMMNYFPTAPRYTWSWKIFIQEMCQEDFTRNGLIQRCNCPQYFIGDQFTSDDTSQWIVGIPYSEYARFYNGLRAYQFILTRVTPFWVSNVWYMFFSIFVSENENPELLNALNPTYALFQMSVDSNYLCVVINSASVLYFTTFYLFTALIIIWHGMPLLWGLIRIPLDIIWYPFACISIYLTLTSRFYVISTEKIQKIDSEWALKRRTENTTQHQAIKDAASKAYSRFDRVEIPQPSLHAAKAILNGSHAINYIDDD